MIKNLTPEIKYVGVDDLDLDLFESQYVVPEGNQLSTAAIEGNHYETPNEYQIYVYYHPFAARYDRLIGIGVLNAHSQVSTR